MEEVPPLTAIEIETARAQMGGCDDRVLAQLADALWSESETRIQEVHAAIEQQDCGAVARAAHAFKGAAALFGAHAVVQRLKQIERSSRENNVQAIAEQFPDLEAQTDRMRQELAHFVGKNQSNS